MAKIEMNLQKREGKGKNKVSKLRNEDIIPCVLYSRGEETESLQVDSKEFRRVFKEAGTSALITLKIDGDTCPAIIKDIQTHPYKNLVLHVDLQKLHMDEKVKMTVPVILHGRDSIRLQPSILIQVLDTVDIECYPADIPSNGGEVNVENMTFETPLFVKDLDIAEEGKVDILTDLDEVVCILQEPSAYVEEEEEGEEETHEVEVITEKKDDEEEE